MLRARQRSPCTCGHESSGDDDRLQVPFTCRGDWDAGAADAAGGAAARRRVLTASRSHPPRRCEAGSRASAPGQVQRVEPPELRA
ncbi:MAG: DUF3011 domain-containing protein [Deltaproteobacteria bacterium]|nr:DUF3011 domain-containing protein [Deltaproteobacteria bacterium]